MNLVVLRNQNQPTGLLVEAMHNAWTGITIESAELTKTIQQRIDQCAAIAVLVSGSGVHHHARRLVDDRQILILVHDGKRYVFWEGLQRRTLGFTGNLDQLAAAKL